MGNHESLELFLNLSRKELQGLCKRHNLPANRSHAQLAKSLVSHLKRKNSGSKPGIPKATYSTNGTIERRKSDHRQHLPPGIQINRSGEIKRQSLEKVYNTDSNVAFAIASSNEKGEAFGNATCAPCADGPVLLIAPNIRDVAKTFQHSSECHNQGNRQESQKAINLWNSAQNLLNYSATYCKNCNSASVPCNHRRVSGCSMPSGFVSSDEVFTKAAPSFEFFVTSEDGINLYVDLNSSPADWINNLKNEVCIDQNVEHCKSKTLCHHVRSMPDANEPMMPSNNVKIDYQGNEAENSRRMYSSFSSVASRNCQSEAYHIDAIAKTSTSCALTLTSMPVENSGHILGDQVVSSSCITHSDVTNHVRGCISSCPRNNDVRPQDSVEVVLNIEKTDTPMLDASLSIDILSPDEREYQNTVEYQTQELVTFDAAEVGLPDKAVASGHEKLSSPKSNRVYNIGTPYMENLKKHGSALQVSAESGPVEGLSEALDHNISLETDFCRPKGQLMLDCPVADAQSDVGSSNHIHSHHRSCSLRSSVMEVPASAFDDELVGRSILERAKESSECSQFPGFFGKRPPSQALQEEFQSKRLHTKVESKGLPVFCSSTSKPLVLPRRSSRLVFKGDQSKLNTQN